MAGEEAGGKPSVIEDLTRSAKRRWAVLGIGLALLALLFIFAGMIRTPGARKNPYTVIASRVLAVAGAVMLTRIVLLTHDDGTPVFLVECAAGGDVVDEGLEIVSDRFEVVPLSDVLAFVRDQRYVPKKGVAVVLRAETPGELEAAAAALEKRSRLGMFPAAILLGEAALDGMAESAGPGFPEDVSLAVTVRGKDEDEAAGAVKKAAAALGRAGLRAPLYARIENDSALVLGKIGKAAAIEAFFGGEGLNRYGDRGNRIRLADITGLLAARKGRGARLGAYTTMYRGNYLAYPGWLWLEKTAPAPDWRARA